MGRKIDLITMEMLPGRGAPVAGGGLRAWSLAASLISAGHEVRLCVPETLAQKYDLSDLPSFRPDTLPEFVERSPAELFLFEQWYPLSCVERVDRPVVVDLPGPLLLENHWRRVAATERMALAKLRALAQADLWLYATPRQRYYWLAFMALAGQDLGAPPLVHTPIALPRLPPATGPRDPQAFVYAGVFWPWQDPSRALAALLAAMERRGQGRLEVYGGPHPQHDVEGQKYLDPTLSLPASPRLSFHGTMPFEPLTARLQTAGVAVDVVPDNAERELSSTIRTVVYLHCGLAVVVSRHSYLAEVIAGHGAGWVMEGVEGGELTPVFESILAHPEEVERRGQAARRLAETHFTCPDAMAGFLAAVEGLTPGKRPLPFTARLDQEVRQLERQLRDRIGYLEGVARAQAGEIDFLKEAVGDRDRSLHAARQCRQALEEAYYTASRDLEALRGSVPYRLLRSLKRLLGKYREPDDHRPQIPTDWNRPLDL